MLYLRSDKIVSNLIDILKCDDIIVYENCFNDIKNKYKLPKKSKIIFSSPSTISYFLKQYTWDKSYTAISIGKTTAKYFPKYINPIIADKTSLNACVKKALELR